MISYITILLFFAYCWGVGFTTTYFLKKPDNSIEKHLLNLGIGLSVLPIVFILLNLFRIPLDWKIIFVLSLAFPVYHFAKKIQKKNFPSPNRILKDQT